MKNFDFTFLCIGSLSALHIKYFVKLKNTLTSNRIFYFWLPLWGVSCSLLYLSRTHSKRQDVKSKIILSGSTETTGFGNPLINSTDNPNNYDFRSGLGDGYYEEYNEDPRIAATVNNPVREKRSKKQHHHQQSKRGIGIIIGAESGPGQGGGPVGGTPGRAFRGVSNSSDSGVLSSLPRLDSSTVYGGSEGAFSGHTEQLFGASDNDFGDVFSPENSYLYRDSAMFSPAANLLTPSQRDKEFRANADT